MSIDAFAAWAGIFLCLSQSAMLSGLNLACFSVSRLQLEMEAFRNNEDAVKVLRLRKDSNFLLTTILWGNVGVNTLLALLSGSVLGGIAAFLFSTVFITVVERFRDAGERVAAALGRFGGYRRHTLFAVGCERISAHRIRDIAARYRPA
jgi:CBS domain containing-hemolysin-like protein